MNAPAIILLVVVVAPVLALLADLGHLASRPAKPEDNRGPRRF